MNGCIFPCNGTLRIRTCRQFAPPRGKRASHVVRAQNNDDSPSKTEVTPVDPSRAEGTSMTPDEEELEREQRRLFKNMMQSVKELPISQGMEDAIDQITYEEFTKGELTAIFEKLADLTFGEQLRILGETESPFTAIKELLKTAAAMLLVSSGMLFYSAELGLHLDVGQSFGMVAGFLLGTLARPFTQIDALVQPLNAQLLKILSDSEDEVFTPWTASSEADMTKAAGSLGITMASVFLLPQALLGWDSIEAVRFGLPFFAGLLVMDFYTILAFYIRYRL